MVFTGTTPLVVATRAQIAVRAGGPLGRIGHAVANRYFLGQLVEADAADAGCGAGEVFVDHILVQAHGFEQLRATVAHDGGDAHLRHDLEHASGKGLGQVLDGRGGIHLEVAVAGEVLDGFECEVGVHRSRAVCNEQRHMVDLTHIAGLDHHGDLRAGVATQQMVLDRGGEQQGRNRAPGVIGFTIGQHQEIGAVLDGLVDLLEDLIETFLQGLAAACDLVQALDDERLVVSAQDLGTIETLQLRHLIRIKHRKRNEDLLGVQFGIGQQVRFRTDGGFEGGHDLLALPIERRVGDLGELLGEVIEQHAAAAGQRRDRRIVAHRSKRLLAGVGHRREQQLQILFGVAEGALAALHGLAGVVDVLALGKLAHLDGVAFDPLTVRMLGCEGLLDLLVRDDAAFVGVDEEHLARFETALGENVLLRNLRQHTGFGGEHDVAVLGDLPASRTEAVAVEQRAHLGTVGEDDMRRSVPRFDQSVVVFVERPDVGVELVVLFPCRRKHHGDGMRHGASCEVQQFEALVERAGIGVARRGDRQQRLEFAEQFGAQAAFTGRQPVAVALDGVDLAVVGQQTERLGQRPARERVGGEAGVHDGDLRLHALVGQIHEEGLELHGGEHALVGDGACGKRGEVDAHLMFHALADAEGPAIEIDSGEPAFRIGDDQRLEGRHAGQSLQAESVRVGRYDAPCEHFEAFFAHDLGDGAFLLAGSRDVAVEERHTGGVVSRLRKLDVDGGAHELVGHAHQDARAVTGVLLGSDRTTVVQIDEHLDGVVDDLAFRTLVEGGDHTHTACVVLGTRIVHTLGIMDR